MLHTNRTALNIFGACIALLLCLDCMRTVDVSDTSSNIFEGKWVTVASVYKNTLSDPVRFDFEDDPIQIHTVSDSIWDEYLNMESVVIHFRWHYWVVGDSLFKGYTGDSAWFFYKIYKANDTLVIEDKEEISYLVAYNSSRLPASWSDSVISEDMAAIEQRRILESIKNQ